MRDDELQVLGAAQQNGRHRKWIVVSMCLVLMILLSVAGILIYKQKAAVPLGETTIVPDLQQAADSLLNDELELIGGLQGQVIVMEVKTGRVLAMAGRERRYDGKFQPCENFGFQQKPGATMMTAALLALLETGDVKLTDEVETERGVWTLGDSEIMDHNWQHGGNGKITLGRALEISSNIAITKTVRKTFNGREQLYFDLLDKMSFGQPDSIAGIEGLKPIYSTPKDSLWANRRLLWNSIGYERLMAPIQTLAFYNAIANNGKMVKPMLTSGKTEIINEQIASKENIAEMQRLLYDAVNHGLGKKAGVSSLAVAGKTGTTRLNADDSPDDFQISEYHLCFCGYFPAEAPKYSIIVSLNKLGIPASGGGMAGVLFHDIVEWMIAHKACLAVLCGDSVDCSATMEN